MGIGHVQGGTRPPPDHPKWPFGEGLYSGSLWILGMLAVKGGWEQVAGVPPRLADALPADSREAVHQAGLRHPLG